MGAARNFFYRSSQRRPDTCSPPVQPQNRAGPAKTVAGSPLRQPPGNLRRDLRNVGLTDDDPFGFSILQHSVCSRVPGGRCSSAAAPGAAALALERPTCPTVMPVAAPAAKPPEIVGQNAVWRSSAFGLSKSTLEFHWSPEIGGGLDQVQIVSIWASVRRRERPAS